MVPQGPYRAAAAAGTGPASASYDVDAATMHVERHERGIHALRPDTSVADVTQVRSAVRPHGTGPGREAPGKTGRCLGVLIVLTPHTHTARPHGSRRLGVRCATDGGTMVPAGPAIGVLALQGDVPEHLRALEAVGARPAPVRR